MTARLGLECKLYRVTAGPMNTLMANVRNVTLNLESSQADVSTRGTGGWRQLRSGLKDATLDFEMLDLEGDADLTAISGAYFGNTSIEFKVMDGLITDTDSRGLHATMEIVNFSRAEDLEDAVVYNVSAKPAPGTNPAWISGA